MTEDQEVFDLAGKVLAVFYGHDLFTSIQAAGIVLADLLVAGNAQEAQACDMLRFSMRESRKRAPAVHAAPKGGGSAGES